MAVDDVRLKDFTSKAVPVGADLIFGANSADAFNEVSMTVNALFSGYSAALASIAGLTTTANQMIYTTGADTYATMPATALGRSLVGIATASAGRTILGVPLTDAEIDQLENIGAATISAAQWGYVGSMDQSVDTNDNVEFVQATLGNTGLVIGGSTPFSDDGAGVLTLQTVDAIDGTTKTTFQNAITALPNLASVSATPISSTQWGYLGSLDQGLATTDNVQFAQATLGNTGLVIGGSTPFSDNGAGVLTLQTVDALDATTTTTVEDAITTLTNLNEVAGVAISNAQWGTLGNLDQDLRTTDLVEFLRVTVGNTGLIVGSSTPFSDSSGTLTLQNVDALDTTTADTIEDALTNQSLGRKQQTFTYAGDSTAADTVSEIAFGMLDRSTPGDSFVIEEVWLMTGGIVAANDIDYATFEIATRVFNGSGRVIHASATTQTSGSGGLGPMSDLNGYEITVGTPAASNRQLTMKIDKDGAGVQLPPLTIVVNYYAAT